LIAGLYTPFELMLNTIRKTKIFMAKHLPFKPSSIYSYGFEDDNKPTKKKVQRLRFSAPPHNENDTSTSVGSDTSVPESSANAVDLDPHPAYESKDNNPTLTEKSDLQHPPAPSNSEPVMNAVDDHNIIKQQPLPKAPGTYSASTHLDKDPVNSKTVDAESSILRRRRPDPTSPSVENATMDRHTTSVVENTHLGLIFFEIPCETSIRKIIRQFVL